MKLPSARLATFLRASAIALAPLLITGSAFGDVSDPLTLNSRPGAAYTIYLDFGGFSFSGNWGNNASFTPGITLAYNIDSDATTFSPTELADMKEIWSRVAEKYSWANVNVTTVDPAIAAGQAGTDAQRQVYYDNTAKLMHTVIGGNGSWTSGGGISYLTVTGKSQPGSNGYHTDWIFSENLGDGYPQFVGEAAAHENGHGFGLSHQSDYNGNTLVNEYSEGDSLRAPTMGIAYYAQRGLWKVGTAHVNNNGPTTQNDIQTILNTTNNPSIAIANDGIGHTRTTATALPMNGTSINFNTALGVIAPSSTNPSTSGLSNYTTDFWSFTTSAAKVNITANTGRESITPGTADPGATLDASLEILNTSGNVVASSITSNLSETINTNLAAGSYYAEVLSAADPSNTGFFDVGSYFLTGSIRPVVLGDFNQDGHLTTADIPAMEAALVNVTSAEATYGSTYLSIGDINHDGHVNNADLQALVNLLKAGGGSSSPVPEPASLALLAFGSLALVGLEQRRHGS
jgi:hypothetical protein